MKYLFLVKCSFVSFISLNTHCDCLSPPEHHLPKAQSRQDLVLSQWLLFFQRRKHTALPLNYIAAWVHRVRKRSCPLLTLLHIAGLSAYLGIILLQGNPHLAQTCINLPSIRGCGQKNKTTSNETPYCNSPLLHWCLVLSYGLIGYMLEQPWGDSDLHQRLSKSLLVWWSEKYKHSIKLPLSLPCTDKAGIPCEICVVSWVVTNPCLCRERT